MAISSKSLHIIAARRNFYHLEFIEFSHATLKQLDQIFQLIDEFDDDESDSVSMTVDECWIYAGDVAGIHKFLLCSDPSFV